MQIFLILYNITKFFYWVCMPISAAYNLVEWTEIWLRNCYVNNHVRQNEVKLSTKSSFSWVSSIFSSFFLVSFFCSKNFVKKKMKRSKKKSRNWKSSMRRKIVKLNSREETVILCKPIPKFVSLFFSSHWMFVILKTLLMNHEQRKRTRGN